MLDRETLTVLGFIIVMAGWYASHVSKLRHEQAKFRLSKKIEAYEKVLWTMAELADFYKSHGTETGLTGQISDKLGRANVVIQLFGSQDLVNDFDDFITAIKESDYEGRRKKHNQLATKIITQLRKELGIEKVIFK